jgi:FkbM family methyltransferase
MLEQIDKDIFIHCLPHICNNPTVFDIGAHKGHYTSFVKEARPSAVVYLFEPNADLAATIKHDNVHNVAVSDGVYKILFHQCESKNDELSSVYEREVFNDIETSAIEVPAITIDYFLEDNKIKIVDFVKIDVEGAELDVLNGAIKSMTLKKIKFLQVEYGGTYPDAGIKFTDVIKFVNSLGYKVFEKADAWTEVTIDNFIEDYRYQNFLLTY